MAYRLSVYSASLEKAQQMLVQVGDLTWLMRAVGVQVLLSVSTLLCVRGPGSVHPEGEWLRVQK